MIPILEDAVDKVGCYRGKTVSLVSEVSFLGGIALTAHGLSELVNNRDKQVGALQIVGGLSTIFVSSYLKQVSRQPKPSYCD